MSNKLIAISGLRNSGKSTASDMLYFCKNTWKLFHTYFWYKHKSFVPKFHNYKIVAFAENLKQMLSVLLNIDRKKFDDRDFKENYYINLKKLYITNSKHAPELMKLSDNKFSKLIQNGSININNYLSIRQLMQYFGTEVMRKYFGKDIWILSTLKYKHNMIISDLRFKNEAEYVKYNHGKIIYISRKSCKPTQHVSEKEVIEMLDNNVYDCIINNDTTLKDLFNQIKNI